MDPLPLTGPTLKNLPDYMGLPNGITQETEEFPVIAVSKSDLELISEYFYVAYSTHNPATGDYELHHAFHQWLNPVFRGLPEEEKAIERPVVNNVYPNPFKAMIQVPLNFKTGGTVNIQLMDLMGRNIVSKEIKAEQFNSTVQLGGLENITPGTYILRTYLNGKRVSTQPVIKK